jgi:hypothetical protein
LAFQRLQHPSHDSKDQDNFDAAITELVNLFVFGDQLGAVALQKDVIKKLFTVMVSQHGLATDFSHDMVYYIYDLKLASARVLQKMTANFYVWQIRRLHFANRSLETLMKDVPEFARDSMRNIGRIAASEHSCRRPAKNPFHDSANRYLEFFDRLTTPEKTEATATESLTTQPPQNPAAALML